MTTAVGRRGNKDAVDFSMSTVSECLNLGVCGASKFV